MTHLEKMELIAHLTTFISGVLKIAILIVALYAIEEGRQERRDAAAAREETLKVLSLVAAPADGRDVAADGSRFRAEFDAPRPVGALEETNAMEKQ